MAGDDAVVVGVGIVSAVGLSARETATAVRGGTMRFTETSIRDHRFAPFTLAEVADGGLPPLVEAVDRTDGLTSRVRRLLRLGAVAVGECLTSIPAGRAHPARGRAPGTSARAADRRTGVHPVVSAAGRWANRCWPQFRCGHRPIGRVGCHRACGRDDTAGSGRLRDRRGDRQLS